MIDRPLPEDRPVIPCTARPAPPPELVEAPPEILALFDAWWDAPPGQRCGPLYDLVQAMLPYRNRWLDVGGRIAWIRKNDTIAVVPKMMPLTQPEEAGK